MKVYEVIGYNREGEEFSTEIFESKEEAEEFKDKLYKEQEQYQNPPIPYEVYNEIIHKAFRISEKPGYIWRPQEQLELELLQEKYPDKNYTMNDLIITRDGDLNGYDNDEPEDYVYEIKTKTIR